MGDGGRDLVELGKRELATLGLMRPETIEAGYVVRMPKAYPTYDEHYRANVEAMRAWLAEHAHNVYPVGRNGMHKYNNQDHSMLHRDAHRREHRGNAGHDIWSVNVEEEYHEEVGVAGDERTGRDAPIIPRRAAEEAAAARQAAGGGATNTS